MLNSIGVITQSVVANGNILFMTDRVKTGSCGCCGAIQHEAGSGLFTLAKAGIYEVSFNANVSSSTVGATALVIKSNGEAIGGTEMDYTAATISTYQSVSANTLIKVCPNTSKTISVANASTTLPVLVKDANIIIKRLA